MGRVRPRCCCLNGLLIPQTGSVCVDGKPTTDPGCLPSLIRRTVGMVFQNPDDQLATTTVESELAFGLENMAVPADEMHQRVEQMLADFKLDSYRNAASHHLSGGEKQRLAIAAALIMRPRYLVLDEPTALLDPHHRRQVIELLHTLRDRHGVATILVTHVPEEAVTSNRIIALAAGKICLDGSPSDVFADVERLQRSGLRVPFARQLSAACHPPFTAVTEQAFAAQWGTRPLIPLSPLLKGLPKPAVESWKLKPSLTSTALASPVRKKASLKCLLSLLQAVFMRLLAPVARARRRLRSI